MCAPVVERHRGEVTFRSEPGRGTCFTLRVPVTASHLTKITSGAPQVAHIVIFQAVNDDIVAPAELIGRLVRTWREASGDNEMADLNLWPGGA